MQFRRAAFYRRVLWLMAWLWCVASPALAGDGTRVLMLVSYHPGMAWSDAQLAGVRTALEGVAPPIDLQIEYLDTKRVAPSDKHFRLVEAVLMSKIGASAPALILASDDDALDLALQLRKRHYPQVPVLFSGVAISRSEALARETRIGGVFDDVNVGSSLTVVLRMLPATRRIVVVHDQSRTSLAQVETLREGLAAQPRLEVEYLTDMPAAAVQARLAQLGPQDLVFALPFNRDANGALFSHEEAADLWASASRAPVAVTRDVAMRPGILGGFLVSGLAQGQAMGELAKQLISGSAPQPLPMKAAPVQATFDYPQLQRWGIDPDLLPPDAVVLNPPPNPLEDLRPYLVWLAALFGSLLIIIGLLLYGIRSRQIAARALQQSEKNYRDLFDHSPDGILIQALPAGHTVEVNPRFLGMFGYTAIEARQLQFKDLRVEAGAAPLTPTQATEAQLRRKDGSVFWAEVSAIELQVGTSNRAVINLRDITDRKRAESLAQEMEHRIRQIYENLPVAVFAIDAQHRVTFWNPQMTRLTGVKAQDVVGTTDSWRGIYPSKRPCLLDVLVDGTKADDITRFFGDNLRASTHVPGALEGEGYFTNADQTQGMWGRFCASPLRDADGTITGAIETMIDITPLKLIQTDLETLNRELEARVETRNAELQRAMGQLLQSEKLAALGSLVAGMAHELNTPIGNVLAVASTLTEDAASFSQKLLSGSARRGDVEKGALRLQEASVLIERNATRAAKLISDFKEVAVDQTSSRRRHFSLLEVMQEILHTTQPLFKGKGHTVTLDIPPDLELDSYPGPLEQIMTNLLANSVHHAFAADGAGEMVIRAESQGEQILLHYRDNGCGIPAANLAHIFEPFYTTKLGKGGSGLGMYLVYNLVSNVLGGRIQVQSPPGEGTWVDITIPRTAPDVATNPLAKGVSQPGF